MNRSITQKLCTNKSNKLSDGHPQTHYSSMTSPTDSDRAGQRDGSLAHSSDICESKQKGSEGRLRTLTVARFSFVFVLAMAVVFTSFC